MKLSAGEMRFGRGGGEERRGDCEIVGNRSLCGARWVRVFREGVGMGEGFGELGSEVLSLCMCANNVYAFVLYGRDDS